MRNRRVVHNTASSCRVAAADIRFGAASAGRDRWGKFLAFIRGPLADIAVRRVIGWG
jgi:hypothetical protein